MYWRRGVSRRMSICTRYSGCLLQKDKQRFVYAKDQHDFILFVFRFVIVSDLFSKLPSFRIVIRQIFLFEICPFSRFPLVSMFCSPPCFSEFRFRRSASALYCRRNAPLTHPLLNTSYGSGFPKYDYFIFFSPQHNVEGLLFYWP